MESLETQPQFFAGNLDSLPIVCICGFSGSGKTTLIEKVIPWLTREGLTVAVVKHDAHGLNIDTPGKDSDRFYQAGANVVASGPGETLTRCHRSSSENPAVFLAQLCQSHDVVLVEGHKDITLPKIWLLNEGEEAPPPQVSHIMATMSRHEDRLSRLLELIVTRVRRCLLERPILGGLLIGGQSRRMGRAKHLLPDSSGRTWVERTVALLDGLCGQVIILGAGHLPDSLTDRTRLPDISDACGPMAAILSAMRWAPNADWLMVACDLPNLEAEALHWLLAQRRPGIWAALPVLQMDGLPQPLLAYYNYRSRPLLEQLAADNVHRPGAVAAHRKVISPVVPANLETSWLNANRPEDIKR